MKFNIEFYSTEKYLPTKRCKKLRSHNIRNNIEVDIKEVTSRDFPVAFIVHDMQSVYEGAKNYDDFDDKNYEFRMFAEEIRTHNGKLFKPIRVTCGAGISTVFEETDYIKQTIQHWYGQEPYPWNSIINNDFSKNSIVKESNVEDKTTEILKAAEDYIIYNGIVWQECGEPMYNIITFGLGHNHGGTGLFIEYAYNPNIGAKNYFNALQREEAIAYGKQIALNRGDTNSVDDMGKYDNIEVLMPEMVKRNPKQEHGDGNAFMNSMEEMINGSSNTMEAGLLVMALTASEISDKA